MRPEDADNAYLWDMLDAARAVQQFVEGKTFKGYMELIRELTALMPPLPETDV